ncbi:hypothetical protein T484DRAFT_2021687 [Baffinella frigidus]|nr:hypothetical protein T484DRAFT_2021687 [Cryptophyta sp. CCMP2293]
MARILGAVLLIATTVDAFNVGSFVAPRAFLPLAGNAGGVSRRQCRPQTLQMSSSPDQEEKMRRARKLADDAKAAMDSAKAAEAKANMYRGKVVNLDPGSEVRTRQLLGNLGGVFYRQWAGLLTGRGDDVGKDPLGLDDTFYSQGAEARAETIKTVFTQFDTDGNGAIDEYELRAGVKEVFGCDALGDEEVAALMKEADLNKNGVIGRDEFNTMVSLVLDKGEAQVLAATQKAANDARTQTRVDTTAAMVKGALTSARLVGDAKETCRVLDDLKTKGGIKLWDTAGAIFYPTGADRMKEMTGMEDPEQDLGLNVNPWTRFRYQGVGVLGISGGAALIAANFLPAQFQDAAVLYGYPEEHRGPSGELRGQAAAAGGRALPGRVPVRGAHRVDRQFRAGAAGNHRLLPQERQRQLRGAQQAGEHRRGGGSPRGPDQEGGGQAVDRADDGAGGGAAKVQEGGVWIPLHCGGVRKAGSGRGQEHPRLGADRDHRGLDARARQVGQLSYRCQLRRRGQLRYRDQLRYVGDYPLSGQQAHTPYRRALARTYLGPLWGRAKWRPPKVDGRTPKVNAPLEVNSLVRKSAGDACRKEGIGPLQGYLAHKKARPFRALH